MLRYDTRANTAQEKLFTVQLVLAALLSSPNPRGRVLILDELGDSLGDEHRKAVLRAISETAARTEITVLGTCQDSVLSDAAAPAGRFCSSSIPPTRRCSTDRPESLDTTTTERASSSPLRPPPGDDRRSDGAAHRRSARSTDRAA